MIASAVAAVATNEHPCLCLPTPQTAQRTAQHTGVHVSLRSTCSWNKQHHPHKGIQRAPGVRGEHVCELTHAQAESPQQVSLVVQHGCCWAVRRLQRVRLCWCWSAGQAAVQLVGRAAHQQTVEMSNLGGLG
jgi:hypothetical protein